MDFTLQVWLSAIDLNPRRRAICEFVSAWPLPPSSQEIRIGVGGLVEWQRASTPRKAVTGDSCLEATRDFLIESFDDDRIAVWDTYWPSRRFRVERNGAALIIGNENTPILVSFCGRNISYPNRDGVPVDTIQRLHEELGDIFVSFRPYAVGWFPPATESRSDTRAARKENADKLLGFVRTVINTGQVNHLVLQPSRWSQEVPIKAALVFHRDPAEFVRDILRHCVMAEDYVKCFNRGGRFSYLAPRNLLPESPEKTDGLKQAIAFCMAEFDHFLGEHQRQIGNSPFHAPLFDMPERLDLVHEYIERNDGTDVGRALATAQDAVCEVLPQGVLVYSPVLGNGDVRYAYKSLLNAVRQ